MVQQNMQAKDVSYNQLFGKYDCQLDGTSITFNGTSTYTWKTRDSEYTGEIQFSNGADHGTSFFIHELSNNYNTPCYFNSDFRRLYVTSEYYDVKVYENWR